MSMIGGICRDCKHWTDRQGWEQSQDGMKLCDRARERWVVFDEAIVAAGVDRDDYHSDAYSRAVTAAFGAAKAVVEDGSSYHAALLTRPDFGCVLFQAKDEDDATDDDDTASALKDGLQKMVEEGLRERLGGQADVTHVDLKSALIEVADKIASFRHDEPITISVDPTTGNMIIASSPEHMAAIQAAVKLRQSAT